MSSKRPDPSLKSALDDLPLAYPSAGFTQRTMQRVRQAHAQAAFFKLRFEDVVLPAFLALFGLLMMVPGLLAAYVFLNADSLWAKTLLLNIRLSFLNLSAGVSWPALTWISLSLMITVVLSAMLALWAWNSRPIRVLPTRRA